MRVQNKIAVVTGAGSRIGRAIAELLAEEVARTFVGTAGKPREVAAAILFLVSDEARYITGSQLMVDGGYSAQ